MSKDKKASKRKKEIIISRVKELRAMKKETQEQFAENIGITSNTVSRIERGEMSLSSEVALKISDAYRVSLDWLFLCSDDSLSPAHQTKMKEVFTIIQEQALLDENPSKAIKLTKRNNASAKKQTHS